MKHKVIVLITFMALLFSGLSSFAFSDDSHEGAVFAPKGVKTTIHTLKDHFSFNELLTDDIETDEEIHSDSKLKSKKFPSIAYVPNFNFGNTISLNQQVLVVKSTGSYPHLHRATVRPIYLKNRVFRI